MTELVDAKDPKVNSLISRRDYPEFAILKGDTLLVREQDTAETGALVVAIVDEKATLTRFGPEAEGSVLGVVLAMSRSI